VLKQLPEGTLDGGLRRHGRRRIQGIVIHMFIEVALFHRHLVHIDDGIDDDVHRDHHDLVAIHELLGQVGDGIGDDHHLGDGLMDQMRLHVHVVDLVGSDRTFVEKQFHDFMGGIGVQMDVQMVVGASDDQ